MDSSPEGFALLVGSKRQEAGAKLEEAGHWGRPGEYVSHTGVFLYASLSLFPTHKEAKNNLYHTFLSSWYSAQAREAKRGHRVSED